MTNTEILQQALSAIFVLINDDHALIDRFFTEDYVQDVDGNRLNRAGFQAHISALKAMVEYCEFQFVSLFEQGENVHSTHFVTVQKKSGLVTKIKVIAHFQFRDGRICACDELTYVMSGTQADKALGSCR